MTEVLEADGARQIEGTREIDGRACILIAASTLGVAVSIIPVAILTLGVFMKPLEQQFGWGRGEIALCLTLLSISMAAAMPVSGRVIDRYGTRKPVIASLVIYAGSMFFLPGLLNGFGLAGLYAWAVIAGAAGAASSSVAYMKVLTAWFDRSRGIVLGIAMSGVGIGGGICPLLAAWLIQRFDWETAFYGLACLPFIIGIPVAFVLRERRQAPIVSHRASAPDPESFPDLSVREAFRTRIFWTLFLFFLIVAAAIHGVQIHLAPLLSDRGMTPSEAAFGVSFTLVVSAVVRLIAGFLIDRVFAPWIGAICFASAGVGCAMLAVEDLSAQYLIAVAFLGAGAGAESDLLGYLVSRYFGLRAFGTLYGWIFAAFMAGSALGPYFLGVSFDSTGSYFSALLWCAGGLAFATGLLFSLPRFRER